MNRSHLLIMALWVTMQAPLVFAEEPLTPVQVSQWVEELETRDGYARLMAWEKFSKFVTATQHADALAQIMKVGIKKKKLGTVESVLGYLSQRGPQMPWSSDLAKQVMAVAKHQDKDLRTGVLKVVNHRPLTEKRQVIETFLNDSDETVRGNALVAIRNWPDRDAVYEKYVTKNKTDKDRTATVKQATTLLNRSRKGQLK